MTANRKDKIVEAVPDLLVALENLVSAYLDNTRDYQSLFNSAYSEKWKDDPADDKEVRDAIAAIAKAKANL